jgi:type VI secretion system secreted protein VgrG
VSPRNGVFARGFRTGRNELLSRDEIHCPQSSLLHHAGSIAISTASEGQTMPGPNQALRQIAINTPLGADVLLVRRCSIREEIGRLFRIDLNLTSKKSDINFDEIIGKNVTLRLELDDQTRYFNGFVSRFVQTKAERSYSVYQATVVPWLWFLTRTSDCRIFQESMEEPPDEMTVPGIIKKVFKDFGFENFVSDDGLSESYRKWEFCVQYRETAFNFVSRLMEQEGIGYYFQHEDGKHTLMLTDSINGHTPYENYATVPYHPHQQGAQDKEAVTDWTVEKELQPGVFAHNDFDFENPRQAAQNGLVAQSSVSRAHENAEFEIYDYPGEFVQHGEGESLAKLRIQELQARHETLEGEASALGLCAGYTFSLEDHPRGDQNREYLITSTAYEIDAGEFETGQGKSGKENWSCNFTSIPTSQPFRPARVTPKPSITGPQTAIVTGGDGDEIHTDSYGRVTVKFHWDRHGEANENSSCWVRVSQAWAGKTWGAIHIPRVGQEVIVEFLEGDPDRPIITGRVYNADQTVPYELPTNKTQSGIKSRSTKEGTPDNFNEIRFEDKKGEEQLYIHAEKDKKVVVENDRTEEVGHDESISIGNDRTESVKNNESISIGKDRTEDVTKNESVTIGENRTTDVGKNDQLTISEKHTVSVGKDQSIEVSGNRTKTVAKDETNTISGNRQEDITKNSKITVGKAFALEATDEISLTSGSASITLKKDGTIQINGKDVTIEGSGKVNVKASSDVIIKGSKIAQN